MPFSLPTLPFDIGALAPYMSQETLDYHYNKHHAAYLSKVNELISGTHFEKMDLEEIVLNSEGELFNNAAQSWNHNFFWNCLSPANETCETPTGKIFDLIIKRWKKFSIFQQEFSHMAITHFGSGWTWLVENSKGELEIRNTPNGYNPLTSNLSPLLTIDVWEHAYYIDYRNLKDDYLSSFWKIINWDFVNQNLDLDSYFAKEIVEDYKGISLT